MAVRASPLQVAASAAAVLAQAEVQVAVQVRCHVSVDASACDTSFDNAAHKRHTRSSVRRYAVARDVSDDTQS